MPPKKTTSKKSLGYTRAQPGIFSLEKFPGVEFKFRIITVDDEAFCHKSFGKTPWELMTSTSIMAADLCRLYFHFLTDDSKKNFIPERRTEIDYETGEEKEVVISGPRLFMQSIDGGSPTEMMLIGKAFFDTLASSCPLENLPDDLKKTVLEAIKRKQEQSKTEAGPMGSTIVDLRPEKSE
jgi:hypothetical protein